MKNQTNQITLKVVVVTAITILMFAVSAITVGAKASINAVVNIKSDGKIITTKEVAVDAEPEKSYIPEGIIDPLEGKASVYDAVLNAVGSENITATYGQYGMYITAIKVEDISYDETNNPYVEKDNGEYTKSSGRAWTFTINLNEIWASMDAKALTEGDTIDVDIKDWVYETGASKVSVIFKTDDGDAEYTDIKIPVPELGFISALNAVNSAIGEDNVVMTGDYIKSMTVEEKTYADNSETDYVLDFNYMISSGDAWTYTVNGVYASEYAPNLKIEYGDIIEFKYSPWIYVMELRGNSFAEVTTPYVLGTLSITDEKGKEFDELPESGSFLANINIMKLANNDMKDYILIVSYDEHGKLMSMNYMSCKLTYREECEFGTLINIPEGKIIGNVKAFVWDGLSTMVPLSNSLEVSQKIELAK